MTTEKIDIIAIREAMVRLMRDSSDFAKVFAWLESRYISATIGMGSSPNDNNTFVCKGRWQEINAIIGEIRQAREKLEKKEN